MGELNRIGKSSRATDDSKRMTYNLKDNKRALYSYFNQDIENRKRKSLEVFSVYYVDWFNCKITSQEDWQILGVWGCSKLNLKFSYATIIIFSCFHPRFPILYNLTNNYCFSYKKRQIYGLQLRHQLVNLLSVTYVCPLCNQWFNVIPLLRSKLSIQEFSHYQS